MPIAVLLPLLLQILAAMPQTIEAVKQIWDLFSSETAPTPEERAAFDAALDEAHKALQAS
jgi:hypothetical protein